MRAGVLGRWCYCCRLRRREVLRARAAAAAEAQAVSARVAVADAGTGSPDWAREPLPLELEELLPWALEALSLIHISPRSTR